MKVALYYQLQNENTNKSVAERELYLVWFVRAWQWKCDVHMSFYYQSNISHIIFIYGFL